MPIVAFLLFGVSVTQAAEFRANVYSPDENKTVVEFSETETSKKIQLGKWACFLDVTDKRTRLAAWCEKGKDFTLSLVDCKDREQDFSNLALGTKGKRGWFLEVGCQKNGPVLLPEGSFESRLPASRKP